MKRLVLTEIARADLARIRRYSTRTWGRDRASKYMDALRDTMKGLVRGTVITRARHDLRPAILTATSGRHGIVFEADESRILIVRVLHDSMTIVATWTRQPLSTKTTECGSRRQPQAVHRAEPPAHRGVGSNSRR